MLPPASSTPDLPGKPGEQVAANHPPQGPAASGTGSHAPGGPPVSPPAPAGAPAALGYLPGADGDHSASAGAQALELTNAIVKLLRIHAGRGPTQARSTITSELAVVHLRDCLTVAEKTLLGADLRELVMQSRDALHDAIRDEAIAVAEQITGRQVVAYLSSQQAEPDHAIIVFVLGG